MSKARNALKDAFRSFLVDAFPEIALNTDNLDRKAEIMTQLCKLWSEENEPKNGESIKKLEEEFVNT